MKITLTGRVVDIKQTQQFNSGFIKRAAWIELAGGGKYPQTIEVEAHKDMTARLDGFGIGDAVEVEAYIQGRVWKDKTKTDRVTNTLKVASINRAAQGGTGNAIACTMQDELADIMPPNVTPRLANEGDAGLPF
jgi:hypothetical protein